MTEQDEQQHDTPAVVDNGNLNEVELYLGDGAGQEVQDPDAVATAIVGRILSATSVDDILGGQQVTAAEDILNVNISIEDVTFNRSDLQEGAGVYAVIHAKKMADDSPVLISCGSRNVMAQLYKLKELGALPVAVVIAKSYKPTSRGFTPMWLEPARDF